MNVTEIYFHDCVKIKASAINLYAGVDAATIQFSNKYDQSIRLMIFGETGFITSLVHAINNEFDPIPELETPTT